MTGRNRNERLSDAQRSALWYLGRGYALSHFDGPGLFPWVMKHGALAESLALRSQVALALLRRGLVAREGRVRFETRYALTPEGAKVAAEIVAEHERKGA